MERKADDLLHARHDALVADTAERKGGPGGQGGGVVCVCVSMVQVGGRMWQ